MWEWWVRFRTLFSPVLVRVYSPGVHCVCIQVWTSNYFWLMFIQFLTGHLRCLPGGAYLCPQRDHFLCHIYLCLWLLIVILSLHTLGFSPRPFHVGIDRQSGTQIGHYNSTNGPYSFVHSLIHLFIHSFFCHQWCIVAINN
jgi:hypothetical protein